MRIPYEKADWSRVLFLYVCYVVIVTLIAWPFTTWPFTTGWNVTYPFRWFWFNYLADSAFWVLIVLVLAEFMFTVIISCFLSLKPAQKDEVLYSDETFREGRHDLYSTSIRNRNLNRSDPLSGEQRVLVEDRRFLDTVGVIIPCHKSAHVIQNTLQGVLHHFRPENVIVMDNGKGEIPQDDTLKKVREVSNDVVYKWVPMGHKGMALLLGNRLMPNRVQHLLVMDDDVIVPKTMIFDNSYFDDDNVSAIAYPIGTVGPDFTLDSRNWVQKLTDMEYKITDTFRAFWSEHSTVLFAHGAISIWRRDRFTEIYEKHPGLPIGEDGWAGRLNLKAGYTMKQDSGPILHTESPAKLIPTLWWSWILCSNEEERKRKVAGFGSPDLFQQRARRWDMNAPRRIPVHLKLFFTYGWGQFRRLNCLNALLFNLVFRLGIIRGFWALFKAYFWVGYIVYTILYSSPLWILLGIAVIYILQLIKYAFMNVWVWRKRKDLRVSLVTILLFPLYRKILTLYRFYGYWRSVLLVGLVPNNSAATDTSFACCSTFLLSNHPKNPWEKHMKLESSLRTFKNNVKWMSGRRP